MRLSEIDPATVNPGEKKDISDMVSSGQAGKIRDYIQQHCSDIVSVMKSTGVYLYRGIKDAKHDVFVGQSRQDRLPKDTRQDISAFFDKALANHGFKALRNNSIFVTSNKLMASGYGDTYAIFPINGFNFTYTNMVDLIIKPNHLIEYPDNLVEDTKEWFVKSKKLYNPDYDLDFLDLFHEMDWDIRSIESMNQNDVETAGYMINAKASICQTLSKLADLHPPNSKIDTSDPFIQKFKGFDKTRSKYWSMDGAIQNLDPQNVNIQLAMREGREIFINGKYVAVNYNITNYGELLDVIVGYRK